MGPSAGAIEVITGPRRTVKLWLAGVGSSLPARSRAFTSKVWAPSARFVMVAVVALAKADQAPPSRRQAKTRLAGGVRVSVPAKLNAASPTRISPLGPSVMAVSGGVWSTISVRAAKAPLPAWSWACAVSVCVPSANCVVSQVAVAVTDAAGGGTAGVSVAVRLWLPTASVRLTTPLPRSVAWASTGTVRRTWVLAGGAGVGTVGGGGG